MKNVRDNKELFKNTLVRTWKATVSLEKEGHTDYKLLIWDVEESTGLTYAL